MVFGTIGGLALASLLDSLLYIGLHTKGLFRMLENGRWFRLGLTSDPLILSIPTLFSAATGTVAGHHRVSGGTGNRSAEAVSALAAAILPSNDKAAIG